MKRLTRQVKVIIDGQPASVSSAVTVAAALSMAGVAVTRWSVQGEPRAPFCGMGICQECRVMINGQRRLACQTLCADGMTVNTGTAHRPGD